jgi:acyl-CoA reductase-like NAD-dependent aldehyde dehydrogenase
VSQRGCPYVAAERAGLPRRLTITGTSEIGARLMGQSAASNKELRVELGGNAHFIV